MIVMLVSYNQTDSDASIIQSDLNELFKWNETWLLKFHPDKCKVLPVFNKNKQYVENIYIMRKRGQH